MSIPVSFVSTDVGAPSLTGLGGSILDIFDYCLVTGLGWSKVYVNGGGTAAVYRAPVGNRQYLRVSQDAGDGASGTRVVTMSSYETMTDVDTGSGLWHTVYFWASWTADATARPWYLIGDDKFFFFWNKFLAVYDDFTYTTAYDKVVFFGDGISINPADVNFSLLSGGYTYLTSFTDTNDPLLVGSTSISNASCVAHKDITGVNAMYMHGRHPFSPTLAPFAVAETSYLAPYGSQWLFQSPLVVDGDSKRPRGWLPGCYSSNILVGSLASATEVDTGIFYFHHLSTTNNHKGLYFRDDGTDWRV